MGAAWIRGAVADALDVAASRVAAAGADGAGPRVGLVTVMATTSRRPDGLLAWVLEDEARTRRLRSVLYVMVPVVVIVVLALAVVMVFAPMAGGLIGGGLGVPAALAAARRQRRTAA
jgi:TRAP-type mannitol/chloroaromatic compound transport system permease large subunit